VTLGTGGSVQGILGPVTVDPLAYSATLTVDDSADGAAHGAVTLSDPGTGFGQITGLAPGTISYRSAGTSSVAVRTGTGSNTVNVLDAVAPLTLVGNSNSTAVNVGRNGSLAGIQNTLAVHNPSYYTDLTLNDSADTANRTVTLTATGVTGLSAGAISFLFNDLKSLTILGGSGANTYNVNGTPGDSVFTGTTLDTGSGVDAITVRAAGTPLTVTTTTGNGGGGNDHVTLGDAGSVQGLTAAVTIYNGPSYDRLTVDDSADGASYPAVAITGGGITGLAPAPLNFTSYSVSTLTVLGGGGNNTYTVTGALALALTLSTGTGVDAVNVQAAAFLSGLTVDSSAGGGADVITLGDAAHTLAGITGPGPVTVTAAAGDALVLNDQGNSAARTYTLTATTVTWAGGPTVSYGGLGSLTLYDSNGGDHVNVESTNAAAFTTVNAGAGGDVFRVTPTSQSLANIAGPLTLNGSGCGADALEFFDQMNPASETYTFDAAPSNLTLATVPVSINFSGVGSVYLETNGLSTVNDASGTVLVDVPPPPAPSSSDHGGGGAHDLLDTAPKGGVAAADAPPARIDHVWSAMADLLLTGPWMDGLVWKEGR
jgi:hypothetical protein